MAIANLNLPLTPVGWIDCGFDVAPGTTVVCTSTGSGLVRGFPAQVANADGCPYLHALYGSTTSFGPGSASTPRLALGRITFSLVFCIKSSGTPGWDETPTIQGGTSTSFNTGSGGRLYMGFHDLDTSSTSSNTGSLDVTLDYAPAASGADGTGSWSGTPSYGRIPDIAIRSI